MLRHSGQNKYKTVRSTNNKNKEAEINMGHRGHTQIKSWTHLLIRKIGTETVYSGTEADINTMHRGCALIYIYICKVLDAPVYRTEVQRPYAQVQRPEINEGTYTL